MKLYFKVLGFACILAIVSCSKNNSETTVIDYGYSYFTIDTTKQYIFAVDSISYNNNSKTIDTFHFQKKIQFTNSIIDTIYNKIWQLQQFCKYKNSNDFIEIQNNFIQFHNNHYIYTNNNTDLLKAIFPLKKGLIWNGNLYNSQGKINSTVNLLNEDFITSDTTFSQALKITEEQSEDFIFSVYRFSVYQKNIGLVYFKNRKVETQNDIPSGYDITERLITVK